MSRPTKQASWWDPPYHNILGGRDLLRAEQGTWLGVTREGRIAVLTNFREEGEVKPEARSRGALVNEFLTQSEDAAPDTGSFVKYLVENDFMRGIGGFSLVCGKVGQPLAVISNRTPDVGSVNWILGGEKATIGLSNALITDRTWTKVTRAEWLLVETIRKDVTSRQPIATLIESLFSILSEDMLPQSQHGQDWETEVKELRKSIFIPALGGDAVVKESAQDIAAAESVNGESLQTSQSEALSSKPSERYGTQKQTIVLVTQDNQMTFIERTLFDAEGHTSPEANERKFEFQLGK